MGARPKPRLNHPSGKFLIRDINEMCCNNIYRVKIGNKKGVKTATEF